MVIVGGWGKAVTVMSAVRWIAACLVAVGMGTGVFVLLLQNAVVAGAVAVNFFILMAFSLLRNNRSWLAVFVIWFLGVFPIESLDLPYKLKSALILLIVSSGWAAAALVHRK